MTTVSSAPGTAPFDQFAGSAKSPDCTSGFHLLNAPSKNQFVFGTAPACDEPAWMAMPPDASEPLTVTFATCARFFTLSFQSAPASVTPLARNSSVASVTPSAKAIAPLPDALKTVGLSDVGNVTSPPVRFRNNVPTDAFAANASSVV